MKTLKMLAILLLFTIMIVSLSACADNGKTSSNSNEGSQTQGQTTDGNEKNHYGTASNDPSDIVETPGFRIFAIDMPAYGEKMLYDPPVVFYDNDVSGRILYITEIYCDEAGFVYLNKSDDSDYPDEIINSESVFIVNMKNDVIYKLGINDQEIDPGYYYFSGPYTSDTSLQYSNAMNLVRERMADDIDENKWYVLCTRSAASLNPK